MRESNLKKTVRRKRKREDAAPPAPATLIAIVIPAEWTDYERHNGHGKPFLLYDSGAGNDRVLIFSTAENLAILQRSTRWYADGTFKARTVRIFKPIVDENLKNL